MAATPRAQRAQRIEPTIEVDGYEPIQDRVIDEQYVVKDEPLLSPLNATRKPGTQPIVFKGIRVLTLEDGTQLHGCADCEATGTRGDITKHRVDEHGRNPGGGGGRGRKADAEPALNVMTLRLGEVVELAQQAGAWEPLITSLMAERDDYKERATRSERELTRIYRALEKVGLKLVVEDED